MKITVRQLPAAITSFSFSPKKIVTDENTLLYLDEIQSYIFGNETCEAVEKLGVDIFDLVFINERPFSEQCSRYLSGIKDEDRNRIKTAFLLRMFYKGENISISHAVCINGHALISDPVSCYLCVEGDRSDKNKKNIIKGKKRGSKEVKIEGRSADTLEAIRLTAMRYGMKEALAYKELIDKYNYRRFSSDLRLNSRPTDIEDINKMLAEKKDKSYADLSLPKTRIRFSVLFSIAYGGFRLEDIYSKRSIFEQIDYEKEKKFSELASALINIINNGNGIEIAHTYIKMINAFTDVELPDVDMTDLSSVMDNYALYYACAALAIECENIFRLNNDLKLYVKQHNITNYWNHVEKVIVMKQYVDIISFCNNMSRFDVDAYLNDPIYKDEILFAFEKAYKFSRQIKNYKKSDNGELYLAGDSFEEDDIDYNFTEDYNVPEDESDAESV